MNWCLGHGMSIKNLVIKIKEIYQALSDTSHVKFKNICFMGEGNGHLIGGFNLSYDVLKQ